MRPFRFAVDFDNTEDVTGSDGDDTDQLGAKYLLSVSSCSLTMRELSFSQFEESVLIFQFLNDKIHNYELFDIILNFVSQKLKK